MSNYVELSKQAILNLTVPEGKNQKIYAFESPRGMRVRVSRARGKLTHTYIVEQRIKGRLQSATVGRFEDFETVQKASRVAKQILAKWALGEDLTNTAQAKLVGKIINKQATFGDLMETYIAWQYSSGKKMARAVENVILRYVKGQNRTSRIWGTRLDEVDGIVIANFISDLKQTATPHVRDHLRRLIKAAFNRAANAQFETDYDPEMKNRWVSLGVKTILPISSRKIEGSDTVKSDSLSLRQLHALMRCIQKLGEDCRNDNRVDAPSIAPIYLRDWYMLFHIYLGGQRISQITELTASSIIDRDGDLFIRATKHRKRVGAGGSRENHLIPITPWIAECIEQMGTPTEGAELRSLKKWEAVNPDNKHYVWNVIQGENTRAPNETTLTKMYEKWIRPLMDQEEVLEPSDKIAPNWIRSSVETLMRQHFDTRGEHLGWLQDHGINNVQNKHYNQYEYLDQKREVLTQWYQLCQGYKYE